MIQADYAMKLDLDRLAWQQAQMQAMQVNPFLAGLYGGLGGGLWDMAFGGQALSCAPPAPSRPRGRCKGCGAPNQAGKCSYCGGWERE